MVDNSLQQGSVVQYNAAYALDRAVIDRPDHISVHYGEQSWSVRESAHITRQLAQLLVAEGVVAGDRVALVAQNSPYHLWLHIACARIGAIFVPISYRFTTAELAELLDYSTPRILILDDYVYEHLDLAKLLVKNKYATYLIPIKLVEDELVAELNFGIKSLANAFTYDGTLQVINTGKQILVSNSALYGNGVEYPQGEAVILFTSGSTGGPKAVVLTHENLWWGSRNLQEGFVYCANDVELVVVPLTHIGGFNGTTLDLFSRGGTIVIVKRFSPYELLQLLETHHVNIMFAVPTIYQALLAHPNFSRTDLSHLRLPLIGGSISSPQLLSRLFAAGLQMVNVWGMTETASSGCYLPASQAEKALGSVGRPFPHVEIKIIDTDTGQENATRGELWIRGRNVITNYWKSTTPKFAWLRTGDLVEVDSCGFIWVTGRIKQLINTGGEKVIPLQVKQVLQEYTGVQDCEVLAIPDPHWGQAVAVALIMEAGFSAPSLLELNVFAKNKLAGYKLPKALIVVDTFPVNSNGKLDYKALQQLFIDA